MNFEIKPGTLCFVRGETNWCAPNNGKVVTVVRAAAHSCGLIKAWDCVSKETMQVLMWPDGTPLVLAPGKKHVINQVHLLPIAGPGLEDDVRHFDIKPLTDVQEQRRAQAAAYGAAIEQVRRL